MKKILFISFLVLFSAVTALAKNNIVEGRILKEGKALSGISVWTIETKEKPTKTNKRGNFRITQTIQEDSLFVYVTIPDADNKPTSRLFTIPLPFSDKIIVNIQLTKDVELSDISIQQIETVSVVSKYGGTVVTRETLEQSGETNLLRAIAVRVPGVEYRNGNLIIRGVGTINLSTDPLFVINGVQTNDAAHFTVLEVESVEVVKGTSTSMFGVRGANGVVIINLR